MAVTAAYGTVNLGTGLTLPVTTGVTPYSALANISANFNFANGTAAGQIDIIVATKLALAASVNNFDLSAVTDIAGGSRSPLRCRFLAAYIDIAETNLAHTVAMAPGASNGWANAVTGILSPGGAGGGTTVAMQVLCFDPMSVGGGVGAVIGASNKIQKFDPGANTINVWLIGGFCSAVS